LEISKQSGGGQQSPRAPGDGTESLSGWTLWGENGVGLHDRVWLTRGVGIVRAGSGAQPPMGARHYLLVLSSRAIFEIAIGKLSASLKKSPGLLLHLEEGGNLSGGYQEQVVNMGGMDGHVEIHRLYRTPTSQLTRVVLTDSREMAAQWAREEPVEPEAWLARQGVESECFAVPACVYDGTSENGTSGWLGEISDDERAMSAAFPRAKRLGSRIWADHTVVLPTESRLVGPIFLGVGVEVPEKSVMVGPLVLTDRAKSVNQAAMPSVVEPLDEKWNLWPVASTHPVFYRLTKRLFDIAFSLVVLLLVSPVMLLVALAIMIEDGRPVFFGHRRQTTFGREFDCLKFRSMVKNADAMQQALRQKGDNDADGPQFTLKNDPRILRTGHFIRKTHLDEMPQFINVLRGDMSVVGPRPSPDNENQFCPVWRETRLSVRAGITGLWQVSSTRKANTDFQEWIKFDIEYVQRRCWRLDIWILLQTVRKCLPRFLGGRSVPQD
jgi:lipopolysaccharide/colanic/teichoic acid biosynthesis glycosyltransferase